MGKIYKWAEIVSNYPDLWVIITDVNKRNGEILSCKLLDVCSFKDRPSYTKHYLDLGIKFRCVRTTSNVPTVGCIVYAN